MIYKKVYIMMSVKVSITELGRITLLHSQQKKKRISESFLEKKSEKEKEEEKPPYSLIILWEEEKIEAVTRPVAIQKKIKNEAVSCLP